jgi:hypothetical protein
VLLGDKAFQTLRVQTLGVNSIRPRTSSFFNFYPKTNLEKRMASVAMARLNLL